MTSATIWTIGHSTRSADELLELLRANQIEMVADVRSYPSSRRYPHFNRETMAGWLEDAGIGYRHLPDLGGRRRKQDIPAQINAAWRSASFRNYADWTLTKRFSEALDELISLASARRIAYMCSEALPWRCHRSLISTALVARGYEIKHIMCSGNHAHELGEWGPQPMVEGESVTYPLPQLAMC